jgi:hypothetical protein
MKRNALVLPLVALALVAIVGCRSRTDRSEGTVLLSVSDFDGLPISVSVGDGPFQIDQITIRNVPKDPNGDTSALQDIEMRSYEVRYTRLDTGTRQLTPLVETLFGVVPVDGTAQFDNLPFLRAEQLANPPLSDLIEFGADQQTGSQVIPVRVTLRFFGRTLSGDDIVSDPVSFNVEIVP